MYPNGEYNGAFWGSDNYLFGATLLNHRWDYNDLPDEVQAYLTEHEGEIRSGADVDRLVREYSMKK